MTLEPNESRSSSDILNDTGSPVVRSCETNGGTNSPTLLNSIAKVIPGDDPCDSGNQDCWMGEPRTDPTDLFPTTNPYVTPSKICLNDVDGQNKLIVNKIPTRPTTLSRELRSNSASSDIPNSPVYEHHNGVSMTTEQSPASETPSTSSDQATSSDRPPVQYIPSSEIDQQQLQFIGSGAFGTVYRGLWCDQVVALKVLNLTSGKIDREASHLCRLAHRNVVRFFGICEISLHDAPALVMEFAHGGPLNCILATHPVLGPATLLNWAIQVATGMAYLHSDARLVHRDLKSSNILIRESISKPYAESDLRDCTLVITDFGMACRSSELVSQQSKLGTVAYAAPEVCRQSNFSFQSDVWSYGVVLWELLTLETPFRHFEQPRLLFIIGMYNYTLHIPEDVPELFTDLLTDCWSATPTDRPTFEKIIARLKCSTYCEFLSMDAEELARVQAGWRDAIATHHQEEQEAAAATFSSSLTDASQRTSLVDDDLTTEKELLQYGWESLDQQWQALVARQQEIDMKEENYTRMLGTMGHQFTLLAVLAANQLKEWLPPAVQSNKPPARTRKRPFVRTFFRWGASSGGTPTTSAGQSIKSNRGTTSTSTTDERKASAGSQRPVATSNSLVESDSANLAQMATPVARSSDSLASSSSQQNRLGCSLGGIPHISPPVNMKHMVHVDHDWIRGHHHGLGDSSMCLFPCVLQTNDYENIMRDRLLSPSDLPAGSRKQCCPTDTHQPVSTDRPYTVGQLRCSPTCDSALVDLPPVERPNSQRWSSGSERATTTSLKPTTSRSQPSMGHRFRVRKQLPKTYRTTPRSLRKAAPASTVVGADPRDIFARTSSMSRGFSHFFVPISPLDPGSPGEGTCDTASVWNTSNHRSHLTDPLTCSHTRKAATIGRSVALQVDRELESSDGSNGLDSFDRRRSASGPILSNHLLNRNSTCCSADTRLCQCTNAKMAEATDKLARLLSSFDPPNPALIGTNRPNSSAEQEWPPAKQSNSNSIETALWSAFRLAFSLSYLPHMENSITGTKDSNPLPSKSVTPTDYDCGGGNATELPPTTEQRGPSDFYKRSTPSRGRFHRNPLKQATRPGGLFRSKFMGKNTAASQPVTSPRPPVGCSTFDSRLRIQSVDRLGQPSAYLCARCREPAVLTELSDDSRIDHQAEFGDPHSPFLGMLAGSGRRPTASSSSCSNTIRGSLAAAAHPFPKSTNPSPTSTLSAYPPCWACVRQSLIPDSTPQRQPATSSCYCRYTPVDSHHPCSIHRVQQQHTPGHSSSEALSNLSSPSADEDPGHQSVDFFNRIRSLSTGTYATATVRPLKSPAVVDHRRHHSQHQQQHPYSLSVRHHSTTSCRVNAAPDRLWPPSTTQRVGPQRSFDLGLPNAHSTGQRQPPSLEQIKADSHPSLSYNPVAHSRDAYLKATQDGYLHPTVPAMSPSPKDYSPKLPPPWGDTTTTTKVRTRLHSLDHRYRLQSSDDEDTAAEERPSTANADSDSDDSDDSLNGFRGEQYTKRKGQQDEDGLTLVPIDGLDAVVDENVCPLRVDANKMGTITAKPCVRGQSVPNAVAPRRVLHRTPAMRSAHKPTFLSLGHYRSRPDCSELWPPKTHENRTSSPVMRDKSPCGPFVSEHSTFL